MYDAPGEMQVDHREGSAGYVHHGPRERLVQGAARRCEALYILPLAQSQVECLAQSQRCMGINFRIVESFEAI